MPKVSVIVPVYNAENAVRRCAESILNQEFRDLELILLDDGSKDRTPEILDQIAAEDDRVIVIHKPNSGVSDTRNTGIDKASGTYIQFLDADDWITSDSTKMLVRTAEERHADLVVAEFYRVSGDLLSRKGSIDTDRVLSPKEYAEYMLVSPADYYYGVIWNKLYRRDILNEYNIRMKKDISFCEDFIFNLDYVRHCKRIAPLRLPVYYYVRTEGSLVSQNMNVSSLLEMKTSVYPYYDEFFRSILTEEEYRQRRSEIAGFLLSVATDDFTVPMSPRTTKVGMEGLPEIADGVKGFTGQLYYLTKFYETYLNTAALKNGLSLNDVKVFSAVRGLGTAESLRDLSDLSGVSETTALASVETLASKGMVKVSLLPFRVSAASDGGAGLMHDLDHADKDFEQACFADTSAADEAVVREFFLRVSAKVVEKRGVKDGTEPE